MILTKSTKMGGSKLEILGITASSAFIATMLGILTPILTRKAYQLLERKKFSFFKNELLNPTRIGAARKTLRTKIAVKPEDVWNDAIFFPCPLPDDADSSLQRLLWYLGEAHTSLKLCIMTINYQKIYEVLLEQHQKGIQVYLFTSYSTATGKGRILRKEGIQVRSRKKGTYSTEMHNKYVLVDDEAVMTGSMNWTAESILRQRENILITTDTRIVPKYVTHFDLMWKDFWDENVDAEGNYINPGTRDYE